MLSHGQISWPKSSVADQYPHSMESIHVPVLLHEVISGLIPDTSPLRTHRGWYVDGTLGGAGHATAFATALKGNINIVGFDRDMHALERAHMTLIKKAHTVLLSHTSFRNMRTILEEHAISGVDAILLDLGFSSDELEHSGRGFSFQKDEPLLMTLGDPKDYLFTARDIVNRWAEEDIANVIFGYGEDRYARRIARRIISYRERKQIETSGELAEIVKGAVPRFGYSKTHPATKTFQALRIAVNDELGALREGLAAGFMSLNPGGRMAVISFHSLEDRIVKDFFKKQKEEHGAHIITKKPIAPSPQERAENPRSRSAKLRIIQK